MYISDERIKSDMLKREEYWTPGDAMKNLEIILIHKTSPLMTGEKKGKRNVAGFSQLQSPKVTFGL